MGIEVSTADGSRYMLDLGGQEEMTVWAELQAMPHEHKWHDVIDTDQNAWRVRESQIVAMRRTAE